MTSRLFTDLLPTPASGETGHSREISPYQRNVDAILEGRRCHVQPRPVDYIEALNQMTRLLQTPNSSDGGSKESHRQTGTRKKLRYYVENGKEVMPTESARMNALSFLREDSRNCASPSPVQESEKERTTTATSGLTCYESFKNSVPDGSLRRMCQVLLTSRTWWNKAVTLTWKTKPLTEEKVVSAQAHLFQSSPTLKRVDIPSKYILFQLAPSVHPTEGTGCGYVRDEQIAMLPTPQHRDYRSPDSPDSGNFKRKVEQGYTIDLNSQIAMLATPKASQIGSTRPNMKGGKTIQDDLNRMKMLPNPTQVDYKSRGPNSVQVGCDNLFKGENAGANLGLKLQPAFVEWMQGFPIGWTDLSL